MDFSEEDLRFVIVDIERVFFELQNSRQIFDIVCMTGGEPLLHPHAVEWTKHVIEKLEKTNIVRSVVVNSNLLIPVPKSIASRIVNFARVGKEKHDTHTAMLDDPFDRGERITRETCHHYRKNRIIVSRHGYTRCCASEGYVRLFAAEHLMMPHLPSDCSAWPNMDEICRHCAFASPNQKFERDVGRPISPIYEHQAELNRAGRKINAKLGAKR